MRHRARLWIGLGAVVLAIGASAFLIDSFRVNTALLRADPDQIPENPQLVKHAVALGKKVYRRNCAACHGADLDGSQAQGVPNPRDKVWLYGSGHIWEIERTVAHGIRSQDPQGWNLAEMPAFGREVPSPTYKIDPLRPDQIDDVAAYVVSLAGQSKANAAATRGAKIYSGVGGCFDCHAADAKGDASIGAPDLTSDIRLYGDGSLAAIRESISYGRHGACPSWVRRLSTLEIRAVAVYLYVRGQGAS